MAYHHGVHGVHPEINTFSTAHPGPPDSCETSQNLTESHQNVTRISLEITQNPDTFLDSRSGALELRNRIYTGYRERSARIPFGYYRVAYSPPYARPRPSRRCTPLPGTRHVLAGGVPVLLAGVSYPQFLPECQRP